MPMKITSKAIAAMEPHTILWDREVRGFNARRQFSDVISYSVVFRTQDQTQRWMKLGRHPILTPHLARKRAIEVLRDVTLGKDPAGERQALRSAPTVNELCDDYEKHANGKKATTVKSDASRIKLHIKPKLGKLKVASVTREHVEDFMHSLSPGSAKRVTTLLGAIFSYAVKRGMCAVNPCHGVEKPKDFVKTRRLSDTEYAQLGSALQNGALQKTVSEAILTLAVTGWRSGEVTTLKFSEVDLERRVATLGDTKTGQSVRPLSCAAIEVIKRQPVREGQQLIFEHRHAKPISDMDHWFAKLGLQKDVTPHTLRHSFASLAADMGIADHTISGLLGHKGRGITSRYMHLGDKALLDASDLVANETLRLMQGSAAR